MKNHRTPPRDSESLTIAVAAACDIIFLITEVKYDLSILGRKVTSIRQN